MLWSVGPQIATAFSAIAASSLAGTPVLLADGDLNLAILKKTASTLPTNTYAPGAYYLVAQAGGVPAKEAAVLKYFLNAEGLTGSTNDNVASYLVDSFNVAVAAVEKLGVNTTNQRILNYVQTLSGWTGINGVYHSPGNHTGLSGLSEGEVKNSPSTLDFTPSPTPASPSCCPTRDTRKPPRVIVITFLSILIAGVSTGAITR